MLIWYFIVDERVFIVENLNDSSIRIDLKKGEEKMGNFYTSMEMNILCFEIWTFKNFFSFLKRKDQTSYSWEEISWNFIEYFIFLFVNELWIGIHEYRKIF